MNHPQRFFFGHIFQTIDLSSLRTTRSAVHVAARTREVAVTSEIEALLAADAVVAIGVSGSKDSVACALAVARRLDAISRRGPRVLVHSDLGRVEWKDSGPACERLTAHLGWEQLIDGASTSGRHAHQMGEALVEQRGAVQKLVLRKAHPAVEYPGPQILHIRI